MPLSSLHRLGNRGPVVPSPQIGPRVWHLTEVVFFFFFFLSFCLFFPLKSDFSDSPFYKTHLNFYLSALSERAGVFSCLIKSLEDGSCISTDACHSSASNKSPFCYFCNWVRSDFSRIVPYCG